MVLSIISLKSVLDENFNKEISQPIEIQNSFNYRFYNKIFRIISVFVKEVSLFYTIWAFVKSPNLFGFFYLLNYLYYFCD